jgi:signal transduction histidine kinase
MPSNRNAKIVLALALLLLALSGTAAGMAIARLYGSEALVRHTYDVEVAVGDLESSLAEVGRYRVSYVDATTPDVLQSFGEAVDKAQAALARIRSLTKDNPFQQALCDRLAANVNERLATSRQAVELKQTHRSTPESELRLTLEVAKTAFDTATISQQMRRHEDELLEQRTRRSKLLYTTLLGILVVSFLLSAWMFWVHYRLLNRELHERKDAENRLRQLSLQLMRVQDEEHRRFARELHDGLGQSLAAAKMIVASAPPEDLEEASCKELLAILDDAISQIRTISYLFHPPFLDEIGFASAAKWLVEGYAQRNAVAVSVKIAPSDGRLPSNIELTLYRVLQESLNNIHRHSKGSKVEISVETDSQRVTLRVKDDGQGIPSDKLEAFEATGTRTGVGLTGMKERVREQGGKLEIQSDMTGTEIRVTIPIDAKIEFSSTSNAESLRQ